MYLIDNEILNFELSMFKKKINTMFVAKVESVDLANNRANITPILKECDIYGTQIAHPIISNVPIMSSNTGKFNIRIPFGVGDLVYVGCNKYHIDFSLENKEVKDNNLYGTSPFGMSNAVILGGIMSDVDTRLDIENPNSLTIQHKASKAKIEVNEDGSIDIKNGNNIIEMDKDGKVSIKSTDVSIESTGTMELKASSSIVVDAPNFKVDNAGTVTAQLDFKGPKRTLETHEHTYINAGGTPTPTTPTT